jgi:predicted dienelactone hydrolase
VNLQQKKKKREREENKSFLFFFEISGEDLWLMNSGDLKGQRETTSSSSSSSSRGKRAAVKLEIVEDPLEEKYGPLHKRSKASQTIQQVIFRFFF